jgi:hypothetical protein
MQGTKIKIKIAFLEIIVTSIVCLVAATLAERLAGAYRPSR